MLVVTSSPDGRSGGESYSRHNNLSRSRGTTSTIVRHMLTGPKASHTGIRSGASSCLSTRTIGLLPCRCSPRVQEHDSGIVKVTHIAGCETVGACPADTGDHRVFDADDVAVSLTLRSKLGCVTCCDRIEWEHSIARSVDELSLIHI